MISVSLSLSLCIYIYIYIHHHLLYLAFIYFAEAPAGNALPAKLVFRNYIFGRGVN